MSSKLWCSINIKVPFVQKNSNFNLFLDCSDVLKFYYLASKLLMVCNFQDGKNAFTNSPLAIESVKQQVERAFHLIGYLPFPTNHRISFAKQHESFGNVPRPFVVSTMVPLFLHLLVHHLQRPLIHHQSHFCLLLSHFLDQKIDHRCDLKSLPKSDSWQRQLTATVHLNDESHLQDFASPPNA
ncbi:hypothetical protein T11_4390 [Trichinella zimbabwensis]|uniref:Uncharacterized protein n=1 Tax=Trichinella zimbabwensis TaxID=268475 RepID=A0A0V1HUJ0_9BILA|nr:hypothetical protein T11_4390 [Trichinella zimbabwensis]